MGDQLIDSETRDSAGGKDYDEQTYQPLVFTESDLRHCVDIAIVNDSTVEDLETFALVLSTTEDRAQVENATEIVIIDDDRKQSQSFLSI